VLREQLAAVYGEDAEAGQCMHYGDRGRCRGEHGHDGDYLIPSEEQWQAEFEAMAQALGSKS